MTPSLFVGFPMDETFDKALATSNSYLAHLLTSGGIYLQMLTHNSTVYLGKYASSNARLGELSLLEKNILSLLKRLAPDYPFSKNPPRLVALLPSHGK